MKAEEAENADVHDNAVEEDDEESYEDDDEGLEDNAWKEGDWPETAGYISALPAAEGRPVHEGPGLSMGSRARRCASVLAEKTTPHNQDTVKTRHIG